MGCLHKLGHFCTSHCAHLRFGQWQGLYPGKSNVARSFGAVTRSERKALLQVLYALWKHRAEDLGGEASTAQAVEGLSVKDYVEVLADECVACFF